MVNREDFLRKPLLLDELYGIRLNALKGYTNHLSGIIWHIMALYTDDNFFQGLFPNHLLGIL